MQFPTVQLFADFELGLFVVQESLTCLTTARSLESQECVVTADHRTSEEVWPGESTVSLRLVQIREGTIGLGLVQPFGYSIEDLRTRLLSCHRGSLEFPIGLFRSLLACPRFTRQVWASALTFV